MTTIKDIVKQRDLLIEQEKRIYLTAINQLNTQMKDLLSEDLGSQFINSCGRDLAGELIRNFFDTSDYNITIDQLAKRIIDFNYENEYDPMEENQDLQKLVYNYNDSQHSSTMKSIISDLEGSKEKLFNKEKKISKSGKIKREYTDKNIIKNGKDEYRSSRNETGTMQDDYTGKDETKAIRCNGQEFSLLDVEHTQALSTAQVYKKYLKSDGEQRLKEFYNSEGNFAMMHKLANQSKGDVKVFDKNGNDITYKATPEQMADAVAKRWESCSQKNKLIELGYLDESGKTTKLAKQTYIKQLKKSQNAESQVILKETNYKEVTKDASKHTSKAFLKIVGGQVIYYTMPPILYEIRMLLKIKGMTIDKALEKLSKAKTRICKYVISKLSRIFEGVISNSIKKFIKSFFDIIINSIKATVKKMIKLAKNLVLATVDAIKIISDKSSTRSQKADAVFNLVSVTITTFVIEVLFEYIERQLNIPEFLLLPLQIIITVACTNFVMLILQKADLFDVKYGFLVANIERVFNEIKEYYENEREVLLQKSNTEIQHLLNEITEEMNFINKNLDELNIYSDDALVQLEKVNKLFDMGIDFNTEWAKYIGYKC